MVRRIAGALGALPLLVIAVMLAAAPASATYPPVVAPGAPTTSTTNPDVGQPFTIALGAGSLDPNVAHTIEYQTSDNGLGEWKTLATGTSDATGAIRATVSIGKQGSYNIRVVGMKSGSLVAYESSVVVGKAAPTKTTDPGGLPSTGGGSTMTIALVGGCLVILGGLAVFVARRREKTLN